MRGVEFINQIRIWSGMPNCEKWNIVIFSAKMDKSYYISNMLSSEAIATGLRRYELLLAILLLTAKSSIANHPSSHGHHHGMRSNENNIFCIQIDD